MTFWTYMLLCSDGSYYTGHTDQLEVRVVQHQNGKGADWTRRRRPVELVWSALLPSRDEAFTAERMIKGWSRAKKEALIKGDWEMLSLLANGPDKRRANALRQAQDER